MTLIEHLTELRSRVLVSATAFVLAGIAAFLLYPWILSFLRHPYCQAAPSHCGFYITGPLDGLALRVKIAAYGGLFLVSPVLLWEWWRFITPGLNPKEKRYAVPFIVASIILFGLGCLVAFVTFPHALRWLDSIGGPSLHEILDPTKYLGLIVLLMVVFGITFEFPVLLVSLEVAGVLSVPTSSPHGDGGPSLRSWSWRASSPRALTRFRCWLWQSPFVSSTRPRSSSVRSSNGDDRATAVDKTTDVVRDPSSFS